jgi:hypothetical protein
VSTSIATEFKFAADHIQSLEWDGDELVDRAGGGRRFSLDGTGGDRRIIWGSLFDAAESSPSGEFSALIARIGTKALLLRRGQLLRQLNRDFAHAEAYLYPLTFARLQDGREIVIHCPESYCRLEIEDAATGERVAPSKPRGPIDFFHSALEVSPNGRWLLSAGWAWHPFSMVMLFDLAAAVRDSAFLDDSKLKPPGDWEMATATFVNDDTVMLATLDEFFGDEGDPLQDRPGKYAVGVWRIGTPDYLRAIKLSHPPGTLMPIGTDFVVTFFEHPRLYDLRNGTLVTAWPHLLSGQQTCSITWSRLPPPIARQSSRARFAVASESAIHVVTIDRAALPP